jgi:hypothetical protein
MFLGGIPWFMAMMAAVPATSRVLMHHGIRNHMEAQGATASFGSRFAAMSTAIEGNETATPCTY